MASWASMGHGMRRRTGAPSNHLESAGKSMARSHQTSDEVYSDASAAGSVRVPIGAAVTYTGSQGTPVAKKNTQAGDPTAGGKANRANIEKIGASYRVQANYSAHIDPAAGATMASARIVPSVSGRNGFDSAVQSADQ